MDVEPVHELCRGHEKQHQVEQKHGSRRASTSAARTGKRKVRASRRRACDSVTPEGSARESLRSSAATLTWVGPEHCVALRRPAAVERDLGV